MATVSDETSEQFETVVTEEDLDLYRRLDQYLVAALEGPSRTFLKRLFEKGLISAKSSMDEPVKLSLKKMPAPGTVIEVEVPPPLPADAVAQNIPLEILYEDEHLLFVNKPAGMVTHPAPGHPDQTLVNAVLYHCKDLQGIGDRIRPGIVHRLDKGTSGVMVVAKTQACHEGLVLLFSEHDIERRYEALVMGHDFADGGKLESTIGRHLRNRQKMAANVKNGKQAITFFRVLKRYEKFSHMELKLETGRTHQIRVHLSELLRSPIMCDPLYGNPPQHLKRLGQPYETILAQWPHPLLHAKVLGLVHPITKEPLRFAVERPSIFERVLEAANDKT